MHSEVMKLQTKETVATYFVNLNLLSSINLLKWGSIRQRALWITPRLVHFIIASELNLQEHKTCAMGELTEALKCHTAIINQTDRV